MLLRAVGDLPAIIWEVLAAIAWEGWVSITNQLRLLMATYPLMVIFFLLSTSGGPLDITVLVSTCCIAYLYASFLYYFRLRDRLPWACIVATLLWFDGGDGPNRQLMRRGAVAVFMLARDDDWSAVVEKRVRGQTLPWQDGSGFAFLYNFEGRELLREVALYWGDGRAGVAADRGGGLGLAVQAGSEADETCRRGEEEGRSGVAGRELS
ncbi:hypothetical protein Landi51_03366 [Colletotrichum acutatum]